MISKFLINISIKTIGKGILNSFESYGLKLEQLNNYTTWEIDYLNKLSIKEQLKIVYNDKYYSLVNYFGEVYYWGYVDDNDINATLSKDIGNCYLIMLLLKFHSEKDKVSYNKLFKEIKLIKEQITNLLNGTEFIL